MTELADKLREARALIERGWTQGEWNRGGSVCSLAALQKARHPVDGDDILRAVTRSQSIVDWNDAPERTQAEVVAAFDRAIELAEQSA